MNVATFWLLVLLLASGCGSAALSAGAGIPPTARQAPLARPWQQVVIRGGTARQRVVLRTMLRGLGATAIRSIRVGRAPRETHRSGAALSFTVAAPAAARRFGVRGMRALWEAAAVSDGYGVRAPRDGLPPLAWQDAGVVLADGRKVGFGGGVVEQYEYRALLGDLPSRRVIAAHVRSAAAEAQLPLRFLGFVHVVRDLPVVVLTAPDHHKLRQRLEVFSRMAKLPGGTVSYLELDSRCGRPVFASGEGIGVDPRWFDICDYTLGCLRLPGDPPPRRTYPC
jgi:hypothetical protein